MHALVQGDADFTCFVQRLAADPVNHDLVFQVACIPGLIDLFRDHIVNAEQSEIVLDRLGKMFLQSPSNTEVLQMNICHIDRRRQILYLLMLQSYCCFDIKLHHIYLYVCHSV